MARRALGVGEYSNIAVRGYVQDGNKASGAKKYRSTEEGEDPVIWRASCRYRPTSGHVKQAESWGATADAAQSDLRAKLKELLAGTVPITGKGVPLKVAAQQWLEQFSKRVTKGKVTRQTLDVYTDILDRVVIPSLGGLKMHELTTGTITSALNEIAELTPSNARTARIILKHVTKYSMQQDWIKTDPMIGTDSYTSETQAPKSLSATELHSVRQAVKAWQSGNRYGPPRGPATLDVLDLLLGTGCRPGEALALRWEDVELGDLPTVTFSGTLVQTRKSGLHRQERTKTKAGYRTLILPAHVANMLTRRLGEPVDGDGTLVFPARGGGLMSPNNFRRGLREALKQADLQGFHPYLLRKTTATAITDATTLEDAAKVLGHSRADVTKKHYVERSILAPDVSEAVQKIFTEINDI